MTTRTLRTVIGLAFIGALVAIIVVGRLGSNDIDTASAPVTVPAIETPPQATASVPQQPDPGSPVPASPGQFARNGDGATAAAETYLELTEVVAGLSPADAAATQRSISSAASADALAAEVEQTMTEIAEQAPDGINVWVSPLGTRATETDAGFEVSIWYVEVIAIGTDLVLDDWRTVTYSLVWENNTWLIDAKVSLVGPVPTRSTTLTPTPPAALVAAVASYNDDGGER